MLGAQGAAQDRGDKAGHTPWPFCNFCREQMRYGAQPGASGAKYAAPCDDNLHALWIQYPEIKAEAGGAALDRCSYGLESNVMLCTYLAPSVPGALCSLAALGVRLTPAATTAAAGWAQAGGPCTPASQAQP